MAEAGATAGSLGAILVLHVGAVWSLAAAAGIVVFAAAVFYREAPVELGLA